MSRPDYYADCTAACERMPECATCHRSKCPRGRDPGVAAVNGYCTRDCPGYDEEPEAGHLWPGELARYDQEDDDVGDE